MRILGIEEIKTVPYAPISHPFVERLIGTIRQELLDQIFQHYFNLNRAHHGIDGKTPSHCANEQQISSISINRFQWKRHCRGLFQLPIAA